MGDALLVFIILAIMLLAQSVKSLCDGFRFLEYVRRRRSEPVGDYAPPATVIIPVTGASPALEANITAFLAQNYPLYDLVLVVEDQRDPAYEVLNVLVRKTSMQSTSSPRSVMIEIAGPARCTGQKVHNLLCGLDVVKADSEVLVFADADGRPGTEWLRALVAPLAKQGVTVSTGFRWYLPGESLVSQLRAAWDTSIATLMSEGESAFPWGGSMAIRAADFRHLKVREHYWASTVSDDYCLGRAVRENGGRIRFEPRCLLASHEDSSFVSFIRWTNRQIIITRVYAPHLWRLGLAAHLLYSLTFVCGLIAVFSPSTTGFEKLCIAGALAVVLGLGMAKGRIRTVVAREIFPEERQSLEKLGNRYWQLAPLVPWVMLCNFVIAGFARTIEWGNVRYRLRSDCEVEILSRQPH